MESQYVYIGSLVVLAGVALAALTLLFFLRRSPLCSICGEGSLERRAFVDRAVPGRFVTLRVCTNDDCFLSDRTIHKGSTKGAK